MSVAQPRAYGRCILFALGLVSMACGGGDSDRVVSGGAGTDDVADAMPEDVPAGACRATSTGSEPCETSGETSGVSEASSGTSAIDSAGELDECQDSEACDGVDVCVANVVGGERDGFACRFACVPTLDETAWCTDNASCCEEGTVCTARGYCVVPSGVDDQDSAGSVVIQRKISDSMPEDLPAGGRLPSETMAFE